MQITGTLMQAAYFQAQYKENYAGRTSPAVNAVDALSKESPSAETAVRKTQIQTGNFADIMDMQYKIDSIRKCEEAPEDTEVSAENTESDEVAEQEDSETTSKIIVNSEGERQLVITTKIGNTEMMTKIKLSQEEPDNKFRKDQDALMNPPKEGEQLSQLEESLKPTQFAAQYASNAYESSFMFA